MSIVTSENNPRQDDKRKTSVVKDASILGVGTVLSQLIYILCLPVATYSYSPELFGYFGFFSSLAGIFAFVGCLNYQNVFFLIDKAREERTLIRLLLISATLVSILSMAIGVAWFALSPEFGQLDLGWFAILMVLAVWPRSLMVGFQAATIKQGHLFNASFAQVARTVTILAVWLVPPLFLEEPSHWFLIGGFALGSWAGLAVFVAKPLNGLDSNESDAERKRPPSLTEIKALAWRYWQFPVFESPAVLLRLLTHYGPIMLYASLYGAVAAGLVTLATQAVIQPTNTIMQSLGDAIRKEYGERLRGRQTAGAFKFMIKAKLAFAGLGVAGGLALAFLGALLAPYILPNEWIATGPALAAIAPRLAAMIVVRPTIMLASLNRWQPAILLFEAAALVIMAVSIFWGWAEGMSFLDNLLLSSTAFAVAGVIFVVGMVIVQAGDAKRLPGSQV